MIVFFDTETIGTPDNYRAPMSDSANWPRMVELAWAISQDGETLEGQHARLIQPDGWAIPPEAEAIHGITTEDCQIHGMPASEVLAEILGVTSRAALLVGHNIEFDLAIVGAELYRIGLGDVADLMAGQLRYCTMRSGVELCRLPGRYGFKWPRLNELYRELFGREPKLAHRAGADVQATAECYFEMRKRGIPGC